MRIKNKGLLALFIYSLAVFPVFALEGDTKEPMTLESNSGFFDDQKGLSVYTGDVIIIQGSMRMEADKVIVYMDKQREITKMVATGNFVTFQQTPEDGKDIVHGKSLKADYFPATKLLVLKKQAVMWQGDNSTASEYIEYDRANELIKAGDVSVSNKRVHVILQPSSEEGK